MNINVALRLGRISNLPTVWTNCLVGAELSNNFVFDYRIFFLLLAISLLYVSGMFLNDAFDYSIDMQVRPDRPIPSGQISQTNVFASGILLMLLGLLIFFSGLAIERVDTDGLGGGVSILLLCVLIVFYDWQHKENLFSPFLMGACRGSVYLTAGLVYSSSLNSMLILAALIGFFWVIGITFLAKQEVSKHTQLWPILFLIIPIIYGLTKLSAGYEVLLVSFILLIVIVHAAIYFKKGNYGVTIATLIAAIALLDGLLLLSNGFELTALFALCMLPVTLFLQKFVAAT